MHNYLLVLAYLRTRLPTYLPSLLTYIVYLPTTYLPCLPMYLQRTYLCCLPIYLPCAPPNIKCLSTYLPNQPVFWVSANIPVVCNMLTKKVCILHVTIELCLIQRNLFHWELLLSKNIDNCANKALTLSQTENIKIFIPAQMQFWIYIL